MKKARIIGMLDLGPLGLLGFSCCSTRLWPRQTADPVDTLKVHLPDTIIFRQNPDTPIKLMYGVPPARFEKMEAPEKQLKTE